MAKRKARKSAPKPLYHAVICPKCGRGKVTRYATFRHCHALHETASNLAGTHEQPARDRAGEWSVTW